MVRSVETSVSLIRAFEGPRHARLYRIWARIMERYEADAQFRVYDNVADQRGHAEMLDRMWREELGRPERYAIFTEFDFLPSEGWLDPPKAVVEATRYCTRNPNTLKLLKHPYPGAWFVVVDKEALLAGREKLRNLHPFAPASPHNDPGNGLFDAMSKINVWWRLLEVKDCMPRHYGVEVEGRGEHLFWSRHYNNPPDMRPAGFCLGDIQTKVDLTISAYEARIGLLREVDLTHDLLAIRSDGAHAAFASPIGHGG